MKPRFMPPILPQSLETEQASRVYVNEYGQTVKMRKKPGRKPNPAPLALRREQNRVAQRAFQKRKEQHLHDLENTIHMLREQRNRAIKELGQQKKANDVTKAKNWYLTGLVLTLHFICMYNNIPIPAHSPYLSKENHDKLEKASPYTAQIYSNVIKRNNVGQNSIRAFDYSDCSAESSSSGTKNGNQNLPFIGSKSKLQTKLELDRKMAKFLNIDVPEKDGESEKGKEGKDEEEETSPPLSDIGLVQWIRLYIRIRTALDMFNNLVPWMRPTHLQLVVPHDPRIDLMTMPHLRDRLIIFSDIVDYDDYFEMTISKSIYRGGDPTAHGSFDIPITDEDKVWSITGSSGL
ncbi:hypothetical protein DFQ28_000009 [Apophysomyces sp. BC1034]|nr:hypothetical protein DFQ28_000009 [Apophysomyces sp. BC1034]